MGNWNTTWGQSKITKWQLQSSIGWWFYDQAFTFDGSPGFGLGIGYRTHDFLQLNLDFKFSPTQKRISTAISHLHLKMLIYNYSLNLKMSKHFFHVNKLQPFLNLGVGGVLMQPLERTVDFGVLKKIDLNLSPDYKWAFNFGIGMILTIMPKLRLQVLYQRYYFLANRIINEEPGDKSKVHRNHYLGIGLATSF
ncbi:MAG: hypothetical protein ACE5HS_10860 [bacterium]